MRRTWIIFRREWRSALNTAPAYVFVVFFLGVCALWLFFVQGFFARGQASLRPYFEIMPAVLAVLMPALTMRTWAEERKSGTLELLLTLPFTPGQLVAGKYLAAMAVVCATLLVSLAVPLSVAGFGDFDAGVLATEYLGVLAMASACASIGQFVSSRARSQVSAFLLSAAVLVILALVGRLPVLTRLPTFLGQALTWISINSHFESFIRGVLDSRDLGYFALVTGFFLYLTSKNLSMAAYR
jgi:ABC-2 type transport system permease protein